jgi:fumarate reductase iron-sulfur subunit
VERDKETLYLDRRKNGFSLGSLGAIMGAVNQTTGDRPARAAQATAAQATRREPPAAGTPAVGDAARAPLAVSVWRGSADGAYAHYEVPRQASQTVLDVVTHIQRHLEPTLSYRYACRVGMCGSCAMTVNGVARWTCRTHVAKVVGVDGRLEIGPLANLPVIKDLAADMSGFFDKWAQAKGRFEGTRTRHDDFATVEPASPERAAANAGIECIGCGVCYASCDVVAWRPAFLGPAALNRAWTLVNDVRDSAQAERLRAVAGDAGCHVCHTQGSCTERCPKQIAPTASIAGLKRVVARAAVRGKL